jgi:hypothetical protein
MPGDIKAIMQPTTRASNRRPRPRVGARTDGFAHPRGRAGTTYGGPFDGQDSPRQYLVMLTKSLPRAKAGVGIHGFSTVHRRHGWCAPRLRGGMLRAL